MYNPRKIFGINKERQTAQFKKILSASISNLLQHNGKIALSGWRLGTLHSNFREFGDH